MTNSRVVELIVDIQSGKKNMFSEIYHAYFSLVFTICVKVLDDPELAKDTASEVFVKIWNKLDNWDAEKGQFSTWVGTIARNQAVDVLRVEKRRIERHIDIDFSNLSDNSPMSIDMLITAECLEMIEYALNKLENRQYATIFRLCYWEGYSYPQISEKLGVKLGTVKANMHRCKLALRKIISSNYPEMVERYL